MTNDARSVTVTVGGKPYTLTLDINALIDLETVLSTAQRDVSWQDALKKAGQGNLRYARAVYWAALHTAHPEMTLVDVGRWMVDAAESGSLGGVMTSLMQSSTPDPEDSRELRAMAGTNGRPRRARAAGTGAH